MKEERESWERDEDSEARERDAEKQKLTPHMATAALSG
jgi:hypothetical protein